MITSFKTYENKDINLDLERHLNDHQYILRNLKKFLKMEFLDTNRKINRKWIVEDLVSDYTNIFDMWYTDDLDEYFIVSYGGSYGKAMRFSLTKEEYKKFIDFLNDPELYVDSNKFNL